MNTLAFNLRWPGIMHLNIFGRHEAFVRLKSSRKENKIFYGNRSVVPTKQSTE